MAASMGFSSSIIGQSISFKRATKHPLHAVPGVNRSHQLQRTEIKLAVERKPMKIFAVPPRDPSMTNTSSSPSPAQTIMLFYSAINDKNFRQLDKLIADDCFFEDYTFPKPFQGKKDVLRFLEQLTLCMSQNMKFNVEHIFEGNDYIVGVDWHLDWNNIQVPFTRGSSHYSLSINGDKLVIDKAQVLVEPPIKLGIVALTVFRIMTTLFDAFPLATEWFLKSPHTLFHLLLKAYTIAIQPIISPFLAWYIKVVNFAVLVLSLTLRILYYLAKIFNM